VRGYGGVATAANDLLPPGLSEAAVAGVTETVGMAFTQSRLLQRGHSLSCKPWP